MYARGGRVPTAGSNVAANRWDHFRSVVTRWDHFRSVVTSSFHRDGLLAACAVSAGMIGRRLVPHRLRRALVLRGQSRFERIYGVDIGDRGVNREGDRLSIAQTNLLYHDNKCYQPMPFNELARLFKALPIDPQEYAFIDLGCGKGGTLVLAADRGFREVIGVEFDPQLATWATRNLQRAGERRSLSCSGDIVNSDAAEYQFPNMPSLILMFNPFGEDTMRAVLRNIEESLRVHPREFYIAYFHAVERNMLGSSPELVSVSIRHVPLRFDMFKRRDSTCLNVEILVSRETSKTNKKLST